MTVFRSEPHQRSDRGRTHMAQAAHRELDSLRPIAEETCHRSATGASFVHARQHLCVRPLGLERLRHRRLAHRHLARGRDQANAIRPCPSCAQAGKFYCAFPAGRRSRKCCRQSTPSRRSASIRQSGAGALATHPQPPVRQRTAAAVTRAAATRLGSIDERSRHDSRIRNAVVMLAAAVVVTPTMGPKPAPQSGLECVRKRSDRALQR